MHNIPIYVARLNNAHNACLQLATQLKLEQIEPSSGFFIARYGVKLACGANMPWTLKRGLDIAILASRRRSLVHLVLMLQIEDIVNARCTIRDHARVRPRTLVSHQALSILSVYLCIHLGITPNTERRVHRIHF